eukprot:CAMPEP_0119044414 /NCGR_PEP_ID=MMETSP1177-20130426/31225_1 /TAXON_ID=2985 /ORGANISM="Ochromonas sp, Strain CCMP1899" /LENGTH=129 /DNA_ID=CAMNT_0007014485 /DNA_START=198 /DNA_END=584 /DNA_ORIENTATION=+
MQRVIPNRTQDDANLINLNSDEATYQRHSLVNKVGLQSYTPVVLLKSSDFLVINKPHDVRMNGDFEVTVERLVLHWYPPFREINLKPVHQLDFATSGALCIALNRKAAAAASEGFHQRRTKKEYLAVVR